MIEPGTAYLGRIAIGNRIGPDVFGDDRARANHRACANSGTRHDHAITANPHVMTDDRGACVIIPEIARKGREPSHVVLLRADGAEIGNRTIAPDRSTLPYMGLFPDNGESANAGGKVLGHSGIELDLWHIGIQILFGWLRHLKQPDPVPVMLDAELHRRVLVF